ncbi:MAG: hypothetical protein J5I81_00815 [Nitrococcus mobilis]|nr:hypothetical protein [Nitrococcus mobilis]
MTKHARECAVGACSAAGLFHKAAARHLAFWGSIPWMIEVAAVLCR